ncbi:MAG: hypothetical protein CBB89_01640 [Rhizobiales bacterium TMED29]|nr:MAG: hypothetical protein CBB89_01640 [Rhizobiales bacterium TMED29]
MRTIRNIDATNNDSHYQCQPNLWEKLTAHPRRICGRSFVIETICDFARLIVLTIKQNFALKSAEIQI